MNCSHCHAPVPVGSTFCPECGTKAAAPGAAGPATPATPPGGARGTYSGLSTVAPMREARSSVLAIGAIFANRYEVLRKLGEGGMGVVYVTRDSSTTEEVVLKLIHPDLVAGDEAQQRLMAEGLTARQIRHPNIVAVYDVAQWQGQPYFTMEYVKGGSLRSWMHKQARDGKDVSLATAAGLMKTMLAGLAEAHRMNVVHRDLKPENVLLVSDPVEGRADLKILDFGIARAIDAPRAASSGTGPIGTPYYMAPEQVTSADAVGPPADFYSLSVMLYELLVEALPQARWEPVTKLRPELPKAIDALLEKGLAARPRSRFSNAAEYAGALDAVVQQGAAPAPDPDPVPVPPPPPPPPPTASWWKTYQAWWAGLSTMAKAGLVGGIIVVGVVANLVDPTTPPTRTGVLDSGGGEVPDDDRDVTPEPPPPPPVRPLPNIAGDMGASERARVDHRLSRPAVFRQRQRQPAHRRRLRQRLERCLLGLGQLWQSVVPDPRRPAGRHRHGLSPRVCQRVTGAVHQPRAAQLTPAMRAGGDVFWRATDEVLQLRTLTATHGRPLSQLRAGGLHAGRVSRRRQGPSSGRLPAAHRFAERLSRRAETGRPAARGRPARRLHAG